LFLQQKSKNHKKGYITRWDHRHGRSFNPRIIFMYFIWAAISRSPSGIYSMQKKTTKENTQWVQLAIEKKKKKKGII